MNRITKIKDWINENAPVLRLVYQNKYLGMVYDRFASLPATKQRQIVIGGSVGSFVLVVGYLLVSYISLWSTSSKSTQYSQMISLLQQFQRTQRAQSSQLRKWEKNSDLAASGQFKSYLMKQAQSAKISPRMAKVNEAPPSGGNSSSNDVHMRQADVSLEKITLTQLMRFLSLVEFGTYHLSISSLRVTNDDKIRGYMNVEMGVVAYLVSSPEAG